MAGISTMSRIVLALALIIIIAFSSVAGTFCFAVRDTGAKGAVPTVSEADTSLVQASSLKFKGFSYVSFAPNELASAGSNSSLNALKSTGANYVSVIVTQFVSSPTSAVIFPDSRWTPTDAAVIDAIRDAHARGMGVLLKPQLGCENLSYSAGNLAPTQPAAWFANYTTFIDHYARIAQNNGVELFCVGCELHQLDTSTYYANWRTVISGVRAIYHGPLTYAADNLGYAQVPFWGLLDYAGIDAYFPLSNATTPSVADLVGGWSHYVDSDGTHNWTNDIETWQVTVHKPVIFTEIGYRSIDYAAQDPGNWAITGVYNGNAQANCYAAALQVFANKPWFVGMFWWDWLPNPNAGGAGNTDYTPQYKPAQDVLTSYWNPNLTATALTLTASTATPVVNQSVTFNATLSSGGTPLSGENATIYHYLNNVRYNDTTNVTNSTGQVTVTTSFGSPGTRTYYATFAGDSSYQNSTSTVVTVNVTKMPTALTLTASNSTPIVNQQVTFNATLRSGGTPLPGENVTIYHYLNNVRYNDTTNVTNSTGQISLTTSWASTGNRTYYATFVGDSSYQNSTSPVVTITVTVGQTQITLTASNTTPAVNQPVTFTATLTNGTTPLSGKIITIYHYLNSVRYNDTTTTTNSTGQVTDTTSWGSAGNRSYYATFAGDSSYLTSTSTVLTITVQ